MLQSLMEIWTAKGGDKDTDTLTRAVLKAALFVAEQGQAYQLHRTGSIKSAEFNLEVGESTVKFSSRWLLNQLIIYLNPYMSYKCVHRKFSTILHPKGGDILTSLSWALGTTQYSQAYSHQPDEEYVWTQPRWPK